MDEYKEKVKKHLAEVFARIQKNYKQQYYPRLNKYDKEINQRIKKCIQSRTTYATRFVLLQKQCSAQYNVGDINPSLRTENLERCIENQLKTKQGCIERIDKCVQKFEDEMNQSINYLLELSKVQK